jgi:hypothetical protein
VIPVLKWSAVVLGTLVLMVVVYAVLVARGG